MTISVRAATIAAAPLFDAAHLLLPHLERGQRIDAGVLRAVMDSAFGGSDTEGAWDWKTAYDACEAATVLFLRKFGPVMRSRAGSNAAMAPMLAKIASLLPTHTRRSEESQTLQQFSTPIALGFRGERRRRDHAGRSGAGAFGRNRLARHFHRACRRLVRSQRTCGKPRWPVAASLSGRRRDKIRRGADRRSSRRGSGAERRADESAILRARQCRSPHGRRRAAPYRLGAVAACRGRASCRDYRGGLRAGQSGLATGVRPPAGTRSRRVLGGDRRRGLCQTWHDHRHSADGDRQNSRRRSYGVSGASWRRAGCRDIARLDRAICAAKAADAGSRSHASSLPPDWRALFRAPWRRDALRRRRQR